jgi:acyl-CoA thioester hydrolase
MARVKLELPERFNFSTELTVRISDINYGQHLGNDAVLAFAHEARLRFLKSFGFTEADVDGVGMIMLDAVVVYKSQAFHGDALNVEVAAADLGPCGCDFLYRMTEKQGGREIARAKTALAFFDYAKNKIARMPKQFRSVMMGSPDPES